MLSQEAASEDSKKTDVRDHRTRVSIVQLNTDRSWDISKSGEVAASPNGKETWQLIRGKARGTYAILHKNSGRYLAVENGRLVAVAADSAVDPAKFLITRVGANAYTIQADDGTYIDASGSQNQTRTILAGPQAKSSSQLWHITPPPPRGSAYPDGPYGNCLPKEEIECSTDWAKLFPPVAGYDRVFGPACVQHDFCYRMGATTYHYHKSKCDKDFHTQTKNICRKMGLVARRACLGAAKAYYEGVKEKGGGSFQHADTGTFCTYEARRND
nr:phospholipase A2 [Mesorhizobium amorphae]